MPIKKAAFKAFRQSKKRAVRNTKVKSDITALVRKVRRAVTGKDASAARTALAAAIKKIDKAVQKKVLKKNTAARYKSRLSKAVNSLGR